MSESTFAHHRPFVLRYYERRREVLTSTPHDADVRRLYEQLAHAALPEFAHWVAVVDSTSGATFSWCLRQHDHSLRDCGEAFVAGLDLGAALTSVASTGDTVAWNVDGGMPRGVVTRLMVEERATGQVVLARSSSSPGWDEDDLGAIHDVVTALGVDLERFRLRYESRQAIRASQRVASQLHQVISASLVVGALNDESAIAQNLARSVRGVFDGERAVVSVRHARGDVVALAQRGRMPRLLTAEESSSSLGTLARDVDEPWVDDGWLGAPVLDAQRRHRGLVAVHRSLDADFSPEDRELAMLLAQLTATALEALDLNRTIQDNETRLRVLVDAAPIGIVESDIHGHVRWWNQSASRLLRWPDYAAEAERDVEWPPGVEAPLRQLWEELLRGGLLDNEEVQAVVAGRERRLSLSAAVVPTGADLPSVLTLLDDVTDQRELREEVRHAHRMELRGQVASSVAHDFNNLITLIMGYAELLTRSVAGDEKSEELVRDIQATSSRASTLTAQLQSIGRTSQPEPVRLDVGATLSANAEVLERIMGSKNSVVWSLADATPAVRVDADLFEQMILNLSLNARDAMPDGGTLSFTTDVRDLAGDVGQPDGLEPGVYVTILISDTGTGMDEATRARCFEPLFTTKGPFKGTGLGLASARRLVSESGGIITCSSEPGRGTTFSIWLPALIDGVEQSTDVASADPLTRTRLDATILLCEDDPGLRRLVRQVLSRNGFDVLESESAEEALELHRSHPGTIDLLVSDVVLPGAAGTDLARRLQAERPELFVVMMSGTASPEVIEALREASAAFLAKPFKPSTLVDTVIALLSRRAVGD